MNEQDDHYRDLKRRQKEHMDSVLGRTERSFSPCMHDNCSNCVGTGVGKDGRACIHALSCPCPRCSPYAFSTIRCGSGTLP